MAISLQQTPKIAGTGSGTSVTVTPAATITNGNGVVVIVAANKAVATISDSTLTNVYSLAQTTNFFTTEFSSIYYLATAVGGITSVTVTIATGLLVVGVYEVIGAITPNAGNATSANTAAPAAGAFTTTNANTIAFACLLSASTATAVPGGYVLDSIAPAGTPGFGAAHLTYTSIQTGINPAWTTSTSGGSGATIEAFTSTNTGSPAVPAQVTPYRRRLFLAGPWPLGLPVQPTWYQAPPVVVPPPPQPPVIGPAAIYPLSIRLGLFRNLPVTPFPPPVPPTPPIPPQPPGPGRGKAKPYLRKMTYTEDARREREIHEFLSSLVNSVAGKGQIVQTASDQYEIRGVGHTAARDPVATDDITQGVSPGMSWLNTVTGKVWINWVNTINAAKWTGPLG